jgi:hypothetical protein
MAELYDNIPMEVEERRKLMSDIIKKAYKKLCE